MTTTYFCGACQDGHPVYPGTMFTADPDDPTAFYLDDRAAKRYFGYPLETCPICDRRPSKPPVLNDQPSPSRTANSRAAVAIARHLPEGLHPATAAHHPPTQPDLLCSVCEEPLDLLLVTAGCHFGCVPHVEWSWTDPIIPKGRFS